MLSGRRVAVSGAVCMLFAVLSGCGYIGPVLPPSPDVPSRITDLAVTELGDDLSISFTTPARTTDNLAVKRISGIDLRIGVPPEPFNDQAWAQSAEKVEVPLPEQNAQTEGSAMPVKATVPAATWVGKHVIVMVRTSIKKTNGESVWSNPVSLDVIKPLSPPQMKVEATAAGFKLSWPSEGEHVEYRISRQSPADKEPVDIGTTNSTDYVDHGSQWNTEYKYTVTAHEGSAESLPSEPQTISSADVFPPSVPTEVTALPSASGIEVSWQRSPESDVKGYYVFRSVDGGPFEKQDGLTPLPAYTDHQVDHGKTYRYEVSAVDLAGNESDKSSPGGTNFP